MSAISLNALNPTPTLHRPLLWCRRQWKDLSRIEATGTLRRIGSIIARIIPALLLILATSVAAIIAVGTSCCSRSEFFGTGNIPVTPRLRLQLGALGIDNNEISDDEIARRLNDGPSDVQCVSVRSLHSRFLEDIARGLPHQEVAAREIKFVVKDSAYRAPVSLQLLASPPVSASDVTDYVFGAGQTLEKREAVGDYLIRHAIVRFTISKNLDRMNFTA
ncbi:MAG TPA: hypothetical protein VLF94_02755 [Chlamydiales bacterium]|nr:hypothetical protein [Chlamydiales bacterium]